MHVLILFPTRVSLFSSLCTFKFSSPRIITQKACCTVFVGAWPNPNVILVGDEKGHFGDFGEARGHAGFSDVYRCCDT
jgi:hypothetical protein